MNPAGFPAGPERGPVLFRTESRCRGRPARGTQTRPTSGGSRNVDLLGDDLAAMAVVAHGESPRGGRGCGRGPIHYGRTGWHGPMGCRRRWGLHSRPSLAPRRPRGYRTRALRQRPAWLRAAADRANPTGGAVNWPRTRVRLVRTCRSAGLVPSQGRHPGHAPQSRVCANSPRRSSKTLATWAMLEFTCFKLRTTS